MAKPLPPRRNLDDVAPFLVNCKAGATVFAKGDATRDLYIIEEGSVELVLDGAVLATLGPGDYFGEQAFFHGGARDMQARAATASRLLRLDQATFEQVVGEAPEIGVLMLARRARDPRVVAPPAPAEAVAPPEPAPPPPPPPPEPVKTGPGRLEVAASGRVIPLPDMAEIRIGRADPKAGIAPEVDLTADDFERTVGRRHARFVRRDGKLFAVEDKPSANGTFVNDVRITPLQETEVPDGARLRFGAVEAIFRI
jgi:hypothetical protein